MGEILEFKSSRDTTPHFSISARVDGKGDWVISVDDFYDNNMENHAIYREIADAMIPLAGGLIHTAEELHPTKKGCIITNITIFGNGDISLHLPPMDTPDRKQWMLSALDSIRRMVERG